MQYIISECFKTVFEKRIMSPKFSKSLKTSKSVKTNKSLEDLNEYCLLEVIDRLPLKDRLKFRQNRRLKYLVECNLKLVKGFRIGRNANNCCDSRHSSLYLGTTGQQNSDFFEFNDKNKLILKLIFKLCPNIKCIEMSVEIDLKSLVWIKRNCKQLECLQLNNSVINSRMTSRQWLQIGDILSDKLIHFSIDSVTNPERLTEFGFCYLIQNLTLLQEFSFDVNELSLEKISPYFGPNLKTLKLNKFYKYQINQNMFNNLRENVQNLEKLEVEGYDIKMLELICNNFPQLKTLNMFFFSSWLNMDSLPQLSQLEDLEHLKIEFYQNRGVINYLAQNEFPKLQSLNLTGISFTPLMFENFELYFPNIRKLVLHNCSLLCDDRSDDFHHRQDCNDCKEKVWKHLSKLKHLKQLSVNLLPRKDTGFSKSYVWTLNDQSFKAIEELDFQWLPYDYKTFMDNLLTPLITFANNNPKRFFKLKVNKDFFEYVTKRRQINGIKYNVLMPFIPRNLMIINSYPKHFFIQY